MASASRVSVLLCLCLAGPWLLKEAQAASKGWQVEAKIYANEFADALITLVNKTSAIQELEKIYQYMTRAELRPVDGQDLLKKVAEDLGNLFKKKKKSLQKLVEAAEDVVTTYKYNTLLKISDVKYVNMETFRDEDVDLTFNSKFQQVVNSSMSGIHVPVEIYEGYPEVLNGIEWSSKLDDIFRKNLEEDPDLHWQYFGSQNGFLRMYPASRWPEPPSGTPDFYDVRRRPWYTEASTSSKDMLILVDTSGSVHGQTLEIMKMAVKVLLNTLGEDDYVNVAWFSNKQEFVSCFRTFVQANSRNKKILFEGVDNMTDGNMASYTAAMKFAFEQFENFDLEKSHFEGSECHKVIMFFTDGGTEDPNDIVDKNNPNRTVRIFTYAVGPHAIPTHTIKAMACKNKGFFNVIGGMSSIRSKIQEYVGVLSRPMALSRQPHFQWTNYYLDAMGLGMVISLTHPVYNRSEGAHNQTIVGVMGVDIPVHEMLKFIPRQKIGVSGYSFGVNNNGLLIFHPDIKEQKEYLADPPDVDMLDVEPPSTEKLREDMINQNIPGKFNTTRVALSDNKYFREQQMIYHYAPIPDTTFSVALAIPVERDVYLSISGIDTKKGLDLQETDGALIAPWKFCRGYPNSTTRSDISLLSSLIQEGQDCNSEMVQHLLWDINKTKTVPRTWQRIVEEKFGMSFRWKTLNVFLGTEGGLTRVYPPTEAERFNEVRDVWKAEYYKRALNHMGEWVFSVKKDNDRNESFVVTAVRSIIIYSEEKIYKPAVVGIQTPEESLLEMMMKGHFEDFKPDFQPSERMAVTRSIICDDSDNLICYLLDNGGYIITSNQEDRYEHIGVFLGEVDPELMLYLHKISVYSKYEIRDNQGKCARLHMTASGPSLRFKFPMSSILRIFDLNWLFDLTAWFYLKQTVWSWLWSFFPSATDALLEYGHSAYHFRPCITVQAVYYLTDLNVNSEFRCDGCNSYRKVSANHLNESNLLLVVADKQCTFNEECTKVPPITQTPQEVSDGDVCNQTARYRRRLPTCYAHNDKEDTSDCSRCSHLRPTVSLCFLFLLFIKFL